MSAAKAFVSAKILWDGSQLIPRAGHDRVRKIFVEIGGVIYWTIIFHNTGEFGAGLARGPEARSVPPHRVCWRPWPVSLGAPRSQHQEFVNSAWSAGEAHSVARRAKNN